MQAFIRSLPKAELHLHLEGTVNAITLVEVSKRVDVKPLSLEEAQELYNYTDFTGFIYAFESLTRRLVGPGEYELIARRMIEQLASQGVVHAEVYVSVGELFRTNKTTPETVSDVFAKTFEALERARTEGERDHGVSIYWIIDAARHHGVEEAAIVFSTAAAFRKQFPSIVGIGLGGDERVLASEPFHALYAEAATHNLHLTNHCGENTPASYIWEALAIGSQRLGHVCSAINDPALLEVLRSRQIAVELNPTSNICLGSYTTFKEHPLRKMFDMGLQVTLNSDDPGFFGSNVANEYFLAHTELNFTAEELKKLAANSFTSSFLPSDAKTKWIAAVDAVQYESVSRTAL